jgi:hypothetical protein
MKTRTQTSTRLPVADLEGDAGADARRAALSDTVRRALEAAASDPSFEERLRRARLALDER